MIHLHCQLLRALGMLLLGTSTEMASGVHDRTLSTHDHPGPPIQKENLDKEASCFYQQKKFLPAKI